MQKKNILFNYIFNKAVQKYLECARIVFSNLIFVTA